MIKHNDHNHVWLFFAVTYAFSWAFWIPDALAAQGMNVPTGIAAFLASPYNPAAFGPLVAAVGLTLFQQGWRGTFALLKRGIDADFERIWLMAIMILPMVLFGGGILLAILSGATTPDFSVVRNPAYALVAFFVILVTGGPLQEEFGWRGYALPRLQSRFSALTSSVILGFFWWLWHLPLVFIPGRFMTDNFLLFLALSVEMMLASILFTWVYNNTNGSVLAALLLHAAINWSIWLFLPSMKMNFSIIGFTVVILVIAVLVIIRIWGAARLSRSTA
ncbi:type II CAAX prenyl endopeptidase Rce1 family protein [Roseiflexus sp.]|uniref:CPBP family glutamic-type intramembrane protease n=1 Tax=Roseiflexus sp. TaxID=2562120 RepID=UPI00398B2385